MAGQTPVVVELPLTKNDSATITSGVQSVSFTAGGGIGSLLYDESRGATAGGWNTLDLDESDYYEFTIIPNGDNKLRFTNLNLDIKLDQVNMRAAIYYSLDNFTINIYPLGQNVYIGQNSSTNLNIPTDFTVRKGETLSLRIYGWSAINEIAEFSIKNVIINGEIVEDTKALDNIFDVTGGGLVCSPTGVTINLSGSELNVEYELLLDGEVTGTTKIGTGEPLIFDGIVNPGTYTITKKGNKLMNGAATVEKDLIAPSFTSSLPVIGIIETDQSSYLHTGTSWDPVATDLCNVSSLVYKLTGHTEGSNTSLDGVAFKIGLTKVIWIATDPSGNFSSISFDVDVKDIGDPVIACPEDQNIAITSGCSYLHSGLLWDPTASDNSGSVTLSYSLSGSTNSPLTPGNSLDGVSFNVGTTTVTWQSEDPTGNVSTCSFKVTITESEKPVISVPVTNQVINISTGCGYKVVGESWDATATDNCTSKPTLSYTLTGSTTNNGTTLNDVTFNIGVTTITWKATDEFGNTSEQSILVTVNEAEQPVISSSITGQIEASIESGCSYVHAGTEWDPTATDNCGIKSFGYTLTGETVGNGQTLDNVVFALGITTVTWTAIDNSGNTKVHSFTVNVTDHIKPTVTCSVVDNITVNTTEGCNYKHNGIAWDASAVDNCQLDEISFNLSGATIKNGTTLHDAIFNVGVTTVIWIAKDISGNSESCSFTVSVSDIIIPDITCPVTSLVTVSTNDGCTYKHSGSTWNATATDNCSISTLTYSLSGATNGTSTSLANVSFNLGTTTVTWTAIDDAGNSSTCSFDVTVTDNLPPVITLPSSGSPIVSTNQACTYLNSGTGWNATATDNCTLKSLTYSLSGSTSGTGTSLADKVFNLGKTTVTWTATDNANNVSTGSYVVTVQDVTKPEFTCPTPLASYNADPGKCTTSLDFSVIASDNCGDPTVVYTVNGIITSFPYDFPVGSTVVNITAKDNSDNVTSCSFTVKVVDNQFPVVSCPTIPASIVNDPSLCGSSQSFNAIVTDNCGIQSTRYLIGTTPISFPYQFPVGTTTVSVIARDNSGNETNCSYTVTVVDTEKPVIQCPTLLASYPNQPGKCSASMTFAATAIDNCSIAQITYSVNGTPITFPYEFPIGSTIVTATARDNSNNLSSPCSFTVTIVDKELPTITCPVTQALYNTDPGKCSATLTFAATASDVCGSAQLRYIVGGNIITFPYNFPAGSTLVTAIARDNSGNERSCSFTVNVKDTEAPVIAPCANVVRPLGVACMTNITVNDPVITEYCNIAKLTWVMTGSTNATSPAIGVNYVPKPYAFNQGVTTITYTVEDASGNSASCSFTVTVNDATAPVFTNCPTDIIIYLPEDQCSTVINYTTPTATDCNLVTVARTEGPASGSTFPAGVTTVVHTATDPWGNVSTCSFKVTVKDVTPPVITCPPPQVLEINANCNVTLTAAEIGMATASDKCSSVIITNDIPANRTFPVGHNYITWTATDVSGNKSTCKQLISVTRGIALVNYSYSNYTIPTVINGIINPTYTATGVTSKQSFSPELLTGGRIEIAASGVAPGPAAFLQSNVAKPGLFTDFKQTSTMQYYQFDILGLGTTYSAFYLYFQFYRENNSDPNFIYVYYSTDGSNFTTSLTVNLKEYKPNTWYEIYQSLKGITALNKSPKVYIRIYYAYTGNPKVYFDNFQYSAFNEDIATGSATATNVNCPGDLTGTITVNNTSPGIWEYTINGGLTWQKDNKFTGLPIGTYDVRMRMPDMASCDVVIDVALPIKSNDVTPPALTCQAPIEIATDNVANSTATILVPNPSATDGCSKPENMLVTWTTSGATTLTGTAAIGTQTFNVGTTNILFTVTDEAGNSSTCTVPVTVLEKPEISCPANIPTWIANPGTCTYTGFPDVPEVIKGANVTLTWVMSGATKGSGTGLINSYTFNLGTTTITWTATNKVGSVSCSQTIVVSDKEAPTFAAPGPFKLCVEDLYQAIYEESNQDIQPDRPEYYLFSPGDEVFDLDITTFKDNCCSLTSNNLKWTIRTFGTGASVISGTGQPSTYSSDIKLPGDGITFHDVEHMITYTLTDCNSNTKEITIPIYIKPRPNIVKMP